MHVFFSLHQIGTFQSKFKQIIFDKSKNKRIAIYFLKIIKNRIKKAKTIELRRGNRHCNFYIELQSGCKLLFHYEKHLQAGFTISLRSPTFQPLYEIELFTMVIVK
jgi:hypothetical protein